ncbi:ribonuclease P protein subunit p40-like isoform X2 [Uranotaenia lowii]|uniref:ribonuclease P protein subunit p40-like isoform X2 n=1 Tax=Uranotaenia lowii TaxID=190385 RepID=UPI0024788CE4|nr:ribonuclease P protein subunit p40-like isoform X2 [Uranotaenia lowii]
MLCPEVWRLSAPSHEINQKTGFLNLKEHESNRKDPIRNGIHSHPFNQLITVVLPDCSEIPKPLESILADSDHYLVRNLSLQALVRRPFVEGFLKRGSFYAVSFRTRLDVDDCVAVTPGGILVLHLNKETYQTLGLEGQLSQFARKRRSKYVVQIDLKALQPETKEYSRIVDRLGADDLGRFDFRITWTPPESNEGSSSICPSSVAKYFASEAEVQVELMPTAVKVHQECSLQVPEFSLRQDEGKEYCSGDELIEYMGMLALSCDTDQEEYLNSYDFCGERIETGTAKVIHWKGFFTTVQVESVYQAVCRALENEKSAFWIGLYVHGFSDSPISFGMRENYFHTDGENSYAVVINPNGEYLWYQVVGNNKKPK